MKRAIAQSLAARLMALGPVEAKSMFSGHGLFLDGICFALVTRDTVFLKVDARNRPEFERAGIAFALPRKRPVQYPGWRSSTEVVGWVGRPAGSPLPLARFLSPVSGF